MKVAYGLALHGLLSLLPCKIQDHLPRDGTTYRRLGHPHQSSIKKMFHKHACPQANIMEAMPRVFPLPKCLEFLSS